MMKKTGLFVFLFFIFIHLHARDIKNRRAEFDAYCARIEKMLDKAFKKQDVDLFAEAIFLNGSDILWLYGKDSTFIPWVEKLEKLRKKTKDKVKRSIYSSVLAEMKLKIISSGYREVLQKENEVQDVVLRSKIQMAVNDIRESVVHPEFLQKTQGDYPELLELSAIRTGVTTNTLYDLVMLRAIELYQKWPIKRLCKPVKQAPVKFSLLCPVNEFLEIPLQEDEEYLINNIFVLYQQLLRFHRNDNRFIFADIELSRLQFLHSYIYSFANPAREELRNLLGGMALDLYDMCKDMPDVGKLIEDIDYIYGTGNEKFSERFYTICLDALKRTDNPENKETIRYVLENMAKPMIRVPLEATPYSRIIYPNREKVLTFEYRGIKNLGIRLVKRTCSAIEYERNSEKCPVEEVYRDSVHLGDSVSYRTKRIEWTLPALKSGIYELHFYTDAVTSPRRATHVLYVSEFETIRVGFSNQFNRILVVDRETGLPVDKVDIVLYGSDREYLKTQRTQGGFVDLANMSVLEYELYKGGISSYPPEIFLYNVDMKDAKPWFRRTHEYTDAETIKKEVLKMGERLELSSVRGGWVPLNSFARIDGKVICDSILPRHPVRYTIYRTEFPAPRLFDKGEVQTDAEGKFHIDILTLCADLGEGTDKLLRQGYDIETEVTLPSGKLLKEKVRFVSGFYDFFAPIELIKDGNPTSSVDKRNPAQFRISTQWLPDVLGNIPCKYTLFRLSGLDRSTASLSGKISVDSGYIYTDSICSDRWSGLPSGIYQLVVTLAGSGQVSIRSSERTFVLYDSEDMKQLPVPSLLWIPDRICKGTYDKEGEIWLGTSESDLNVFVELYCDDKVINYGCEWIKLQQGCIRYKVDYRHVPKGDLQVCFTTVKNGKRAHFTIPVIRTEEENKAYQDYTSIKVIGLNQKRDKR